MSGFGWGSPRAPVVAGGVGSGTVTTSYSQSFLTTTWTLNTADGSYRIVIPVATHGKTPPITIEVFSLVNDINGVVTNHDYQLVQINTYVDPTTQAVTLSVPSSSDVFTGKVVISGAN